jgi:uncharacterized protein (DUF1778 family)
VYVQEVYVQKQTRTARINLRLTPEELDTIREAAEREGVTVTQFMVKAALDKAPGAGFKGTLRRMREAGEV